MRAKIENPVGILRFIVYFLNCSLAGFLGYYLIRVVFFPPISIIKQNVTSFEHLLSDTIWNKTIVQLQTGWLSSLLASVKQFYHSLFFSFFMQQIQVVTFSGVLTVFILSILIYYSLFLGNHRFIEVHVASKNLGQKDYLSFFSAYMHALNKVFHKENILVKKDIMLLERNRWLVSPGAFSITLITLESCFYSGLILALLHTVSSIALKALLVISLNLLILTNHSFELRDEYPALFLLNTEKENLNLYKLSQSTISELFCAKKKLMRMLLIFPLLFILLVNIYVYIHIDISSYNYSFIFVCLLCSIWVAPIFQLYSIPMFAKFDHTHLTEIGRTEEENTLYLSAQSIPRRFIVLPILFILYATIFLTLSDFILHWILISYSLYLIIASSIFVFYANKFSSKGIQRIEKEVIH